MDESTRKFTKELNSGTTALALLAALAKSTKPMYGYELGTLLAGMTDDGLPMNQGALYPVLRSMEKMGLLTSEVEPSVSGPPRRYYKPTSDGRSALKEWKAAWMRTRTWLDEILENRNAISTQRPVKRS